MNIKNMGNIMINFYLHNVVSKGNIRRQISNCRDNSFYLIYNQDFDINDFISALLIFKITNFLNN
jgi:hypothetical protein